MARAGGGMADIGHIYFRGDDCHGGELGARRAP